MSNTQKIVSTLLLLIILVLVNLLAGLSSWKLDLTDDRVYSLSKGSKAIIQKLEEPVYLDFYYSRNAQDIPVIYKNFANRVEALLKQYAAISGGMIRLKTVNPRPDTEEEEAAIAAGIQGSDLPNRESFFMGLTVSQAGQQEVIPMFDPRKEEFLEYDISKIIYSVQLFDKPVLGLITSLPLVAETPQFNPMMQQQPPQNWLIVDQLEAFYNVVTIASPDDLPKHLDALAVIHPQGLTEAMQFVIDQQILKGTPTFIAIDPSSYMQRGEQQQMQRMGGQMGPTSSDLNTLFKTWGIQYNPQLVMADPKYATMIRGNDNRQVAHPAYLSYLAEDLESQDVFMAGIDSLLFAEAGGIEYTDENDQVQWRPVITFSPEVGTLLSMAIGQMDSSSVYSQMGPVEGSPVLAGMLTGKLDSAFPNGRPQADEPMETGADGQTAEPALKQSTDTSTVVIVADTDWMADPFSVRQMFADVFYPINSNLALASNLIEFLSGNRDLISIRGKGSTLRPFDRVDAIERKAQARLQRKYEEVNQQVAELERDLQELQSDREQSSSLVITPQMQQQIDGFRQQLAEKKAEQREIRKAMREEVENLGTLLATINGGLVPLLVFGFALVYFYRRYTRK